MSLKQRSLIMSEVYDFRTKEPEIKFRMDIPKNGHPDVIEYDIFNSLIDMDKAKIINIDKLFTIMKSKLGLSIDDAILFTNRIMDKKR